MIINANKIRLDLKSFTIEDQTGVFQLPRPPFRQQNGRIYLKITDACNAQCSYCFQGSHRTPPTEDITKYDFLLSKILEESTDIVIFGGEPFLPQNLSAINHLFSLSKSRRFIFFSNGYFNEEVCTFLIQNKSQIGPIVISVDGLEETHNQRRPFGQKNGFLHIQNNLSFLQENNIPFSVQINIDANNFEEVPSLVQFLSNSFSNHFPIVLNKVLHSPKEISTVNLLEQYINTKKKTGYSPLYVNCAVLDKISDLLTGRGLSYNRCAVCNTRVYNFANDLIYCCPQISQSIIGSFNKTNEIISEKALSNFYTCTNKENLKCINCELRFLCDFGCIDDNTTYKCNCKENTLSAIQLILNNFDLFNIFD